MVYSTCMYFDHRIGIKVFEVYPIFCLSLAGDCSNKKVANSEKFSRDTFVSQKKKQKICYFICVCFQDRPVGVVELGEPL